MIHHPSILQNLNKFRVIKMLGFKTKELRRSARSCTELRGVDVEEGRTFFFLFRAESSCEGKSRPFTDGLDVGELVGDPEFCRESSEEATEPRRLAHVRQFWVGPGRRLRGPGEGETSYEASLV